MIQHEHGNCSGCEQWKPIVNKHFRLCFTCNNKRLNRDKEKTQTKQKAIRPRSERGVKVANRDRSFFLGIWNKRPHFSQVSGEFLGHKFKAVFMSHVLPKSIYPNFRHYEKNIVLMSFEEHDAWGNSPKQDSEEFKEKFSTVLQLREELKKEYFQHAKIGTQTI
jgi:hypothetical protein